MADPPLHIALIADPYLPVPPKHYGGIERVVAFLVEGLAKRGHDVTLWAAPGSAVPCETVPYGRPPHTGPLNRLGELADVAGGLLRRRSFDLVHSFGRLAAALPAALAGTPAVQSYQREVTPRNVAIAARLAGRRIRFTACSDACWRPVAGLGTWSTVYNGVRLSDYTFQSRVEADAPLVFLGRIERIKGVHTAIKVAQKTGERLVIAGNIPEEHRGYFDAEVRPHVSDRITYVGPVDDRQKNELLGRALAFLMPIEWEEPFGIVMAEALACGTPVVGMRRGSVPEVVRDGTTGFVCDTVDEMVSAVGQVAGLDRAAARADAEARFSDRAIVDAYEALYREHIAVNTR